jgi:hypothetical protein
MNTAYITNGHGLRCYTKEKPHRKNLPSRLAVKAFTQIANDMAQSSMQWTNCYTHTHAHTQNLYIYKYMRWVLNCFKLSRCLITNERKTPRHRNFNKCHNATGMPASYSGCPECESRSKHQLSWMRVFSFPQSLQANAGMVLIGHDHFQILSNTSFGTTLTYNAT